VLPETGHGSFQVALQSHVAKRRTNRLSGEDLSKDLEYAFDPPTLEIEGHAEASSDLTVMPRVRPAFGMRNSHKFQIIATPTEPGLAPTETIGELVVTPKVSLGWVIIVFVAAIALIGLYFQLCRLGNLPGCAAPDIAFNVSPAQLQQGGTTTLTWQVSGAESVELLPSPGHVRSSGSLPLTVNKTTTYTLRATGENGRTTEKSVTVTIVGVPPLIERFDAQPPTLVSGQVPDITLSWSAPDADSVTISNVEGIFMASGSVTTDAPAQTQTYTLVARNAAGTSSAEITVAVEDVGCVVASFAGATVPLHEGPGQGYRTIGTVSPGAVVTPRYRSSSGDWAYVTVSNRDGWIRRQDLSCAVSAELPTVDPNQFPQIP
jgi:hypothetical protein